MNSEEEREILEGWGWEYEYVGRRWIAPDGFVLETETLVLVAEEMGEAMETRLREIAREHGKASCGE